MKTIIRITVALLAATASAAWARCDDPAAADAVRARIAATCICDQSTNHGQYVSCVVREVRQAVASGELPVNCKGAVTKCAARSTCGKKAGFSTCCFATQTACDLTSGTCLEDGVTPCASDAECPVETKCRIKSTADKCVAAGGSPGTGSCCDAVCSVVP